jgi:peptidoglycan hydrolase-like protein with peptidoglycan-binding domain
MREETPFEDFEATCTVGEGDTLLDHESHRGAKRPRAKLITRARARRGPFRVFYPCAIPGISLTDYSKLPSGKGWGAPCTGNRTTITLTNGVRLTVRTEIAELTRLIMNANIRQGYSYRQVDTGAYNCRKIAGTTTWSNHAWGLAIDENWQTNPFTSTLRTDRPAWEQQRWQRYGFALGINYTGKKDAMHNEFMGTPAQAAQALALAQKEIGNGVAPTPVDPNTSLPTLSYGQTSDAVTHLQRFMVSHFPSYNKYTPTGYYGDQTKAGIAEFQKRVGITGSDADGSIVGPRTNAALYKYGYRG